MTRRACCDLGSALRVSSSARARTSGTHSVRGAPLYLSESAAVSLNHPIRPRYRDSSSESSLGVAAEKRSFARQLDPRAALPYARHVTDQIVGIDTQALMLSFQLDGASFETTDIRDLNDWHAKLNSAWRNLANDRLTVWHHLVRREHHGYPQGKFRSACAAGLDAHLSRPARRDADVRQRALCDAGPASGS